MHRERIFRDHSTALDTLTDLELIERYRLPQKSLLRLTDLLIYDLERPTAMSHSVPPYLQVTIVLQRPLAENVRFRLFQFLINIPIKPPLVSIGNLSVFHVLSDKI